MTTSNPPTASTSTRPTRARRTWWGFVLRAGVVVLGLAVVLLLLAPMVVTSRVGERWIAGYASGMVGRPVEIEGLAVGWMTPLSIERVEMPALPDEGDFPAARIDGLRVPLTLTGIVLGGPYALDLECDRLEGNLVRRGNGAWNWVEVAGKFSTPADKTPAPKSTQPTVLPLARIKARFAAIDLRVVDASQDLNAGIAGGTLGLDWPGGAQPMTMDAAGALALNASRLPWDIRAKVEHWIDDAGRLTLDKIAVTSGSDAMGGANQITDGGYFLHAGADTAEANELRVVLPMGELAGFARNSGWGPLATLPAMEGEVDWRVTATRHANAPRVELTSAVDGHDVRILPDGDGMAHVPPIDLHHLIEATVDYDRQSVDVGMTSLQAEGLFVEARATNVAFAEPMKAQAVTAHVQADFARLSSLASRIAGGDGEAILSGTLAIDAQALPVDGDADALGLDGQVVLRPGTLTTLRPFAANDDLLASGPLELAPLGFAWEGSGRLDRVAGRVAITTDAFEGDALRGFDAAWTQDDWSLNSWTLNYSLDVDLERAHETLRGPLLPGIASMSGNIRQGGEVSSAMAAAFGGGGLFLAADDFSLRMVDWPGAFEPGPVSLACAAWSYDQSKGQARVDALEFEGLGVRAEGAGSWLDTFDVTTSATLDLAAMGAKLGPLNSLPEGLGGVLLIDAATSGSLTGDAVLAVAATSEENLTLAMPGVLTIDQPLRMRGRTEATMDAAGAPTRVAAWVEEASLGSLGSLTGHGAMTPGASMELGGGLVVDYEGLLGALDASLFEASDLAVMAVGKTELSMLATGKLDDVASPWMPRRIDVSGRMTTGIDSVEWAAGDAAGGVGGVADERTFSAVINMADMAASRFEEQGRLSIDAIDGPEPMGLSTLEFETHTTSEGFDTWRLQVPRLAVGEARYEVPLTLRLAVTDMATSGSVDLDLSAQTMTIAGVGASVADVAKANVHGATFNWGTGAWSVDADGSVDDLRALATLYTLDPVLAETMPGYAGGVRGSIKGDGDLRFDEMMAKGHVPFRGDAALAMTDGVLNIRDGMRVSGVNVEMAVSSPGEDLLLMTGKGGIGALSNAALAPKPVRDATFEFEAGMLALDQLEWRVIDFNSGNWRTRASATGSATGLRPALAGPIASGLHYWLDAVRFEMEARIEQDFAGFNNYLDPLTASGVADVTLRVSSTPQTALTSTALLDLRSIAVAWGEVFSLEGLAGTAELRKTLVHGPLGRVPPSLPAGNLRLDRLAFGLPPYVAEMRDTRVAIKGLEPGLTLRTTTTQLLAGTAVTSWDISLREGDPVITGRIESTGLDLAALAAEITTQQTRRSWEMNGVADLQWRLRDVQGSRFMEDLSVAIRSTRIGDRAFRRLLDGLDPRGDNPQLIAARRALVLGSPDSTSFTLEGGLVSFDARLKSTAGLMFPLPILDRQPYSGLFAVYGLDETVGLMALARAGLVLMLAPDVATIEAAAGMN